MQQFVAFQNNTQWCHLNKQENIFLFCSIVGLLKNTLAFLNNSVLKGKTKRSSVPIQSNSKYQTIPGKIFAEPDLLSPLLSISLR